MGQEFWEDVSYVEISSNRRKALRFLVDAGRPLTPTELSDRMGVVLKTASRAVRELQDRELVECVNPEEPRYRRYSATEEGRMIEEELEQELEIGPGGLALAEKPVQYEVREASEEVQDGVSYVRRSENRRAVLDILGSSERPATASELSEVMDIGRDSASRALRQLEDRGLTRCLNPDSPRYRRYRITESGERVLELFQD
ncbi:MAG: ArsR family transcriptional regulator [Candidatus Nanohaloarchaeota archaeon QJJ-7]|nr:ArsR family transcriptional regulator [Candidatus Nanohaloarchaeota archaeon QJJ-7]